MNQPSDAEIATVVRELATALMRVMPATPLSRTAAACLGDMDRLGPQRVTAMADRQHVSQPSMTGLVQRLEAGGLAVRETDPDDRRASLIAITDLGRKTLEERRRLYDDAVAATLGTLSPAHRDALAHALPALQALTENHADL